MGGMFKAAARRGSRMARDLAGLPNLITPEINALNGSFSYTESDSLKLADILKLDRSGLRAGSGGNWKAESGFNEKVKAAEVRKGGIFSELKINSEREKRDAEEEEGRIAAGIAAAAEAATAAKAEAAALLVKKKAEEKRVATAMRRIKGAIHLEDKLGVFYDKYLAPVSDGIEMGELIRINNEIFRDRFEFIGFLIKMFGLNISDDVVGYFLNYLELLFAAGIFPAQLDIRVFILYQLFHLHNGQIFPLHFYSNMMKFSRNLTGVLGEAHLKVLEFTVDKEMSPPKTCLQWIGRDEGKVKKLYIDQIPEGGVKLGSDQEKKLISFSAVRGAPDGIFRAETYDLALFWYNLIKLEKHKEGLRIRNAPVKPPNVFIIDPPPMDASIAMAKAVAETEAVAEAEERRLAQEDAAAAEMQQPPEAAVDSVVFQSQTQAAAADDLAAADGLAAADDLAAAAAAGRAEFNSVQQILDQQAKFTTRVKKLPVIDEYHKQLVILGRLCSPYPGDLPKSHNISLTPQMLKAQSDMDNFKPDRLKSLVNGRFKDDKLIRRVHAIAVKKEFKPEYLDGVQGNHVFYGDSGKPSVPGGESSIQQASEEFNSELESGVLWNISLLKWLKKVNDIGEDVGDLSGDL